MILVELTCDMRPKRAGEDILLPDGVAQRLIDLGEARNPRDRFGAPIEPMVVAPEKKRRYLTK